MIYRNYKTLSNQNKQQGQVVSSKDIYLIARNLFLEFGYLAIVDFFFIRPFCMYWTYILTRNYFIGIILEKIVADSLFYFLSIVNYEIIKKKS